MSMTHGEFIEKMNQPKPDNFDELSNYRQWQWKNYRERHENDPRCPALAEFSHGRVLRMAKCFPDIANAERLRESLIRKYAKDFSGPFRNNRIGLFKPMVRKAFELAGLEYNELNGEPFVHWKHLKEIQDDKSA